LVGNELVVGKPFEAVAIIDTCELDDEETVSVDADDTDTLDDDDIDIIPVDDANCTVDDAPELGTPDIVTLLKLESVNVGDNVIDNVTSLLIDGNPEIEDNADTELRATVGVTESLNDVMAENVDDCDTAFTVTVASKGVAETHAVVERDTIS